MKWQVVVAVLFFVSLSFSFFDNFSISNLSGTNSGVSGLSEKYNQNISQNSSVSVPFGQITRRLNISTSFDVAGFSTMYENSIYPSDDLRLFFASGSSFSELTSLPSSGYPDFNCNSSPNTFGVYAWRCDFDNDDCVEYINNTFTYHNLTANLSFQNYSILMPFNSSTVDIPSQMVELMKNSSGADTLNIHVYGTTNAGYVIDDRSMGFDCSSNYKNYSQNFSVDYNYSFYVLGTHSMFFLAAPVINEQWFRNNRFDVVVLSQAPISSAGYFLDNSSTSNITIRHFDLVQNEYGIFKIVSNYTGTNSSNYSESFNYTQPRQLSKDNLSYSYIYRFNYSYLGLGDHNLSFYIHEPFSAKTSYFDQQLTSRMLSVDNQYMENGAPIDTNLSRPSSQSANWPIGNISLLLGGLSLLLIISYVRFFMR